MPRFIHTADWQIGRQYSSIEPEDGVALSEARLVVVERIAALATKEAVDAVLVAGDVFDTQTVSDRTIRRLFNALSGFSGPWILIPGNHDASLAESVWTRAQRLDAVPPNAHLALAPEPIEFNQQGFVILPAPLTQRHTQADHTEWFDHAETASGLARIGIAHGSVQGILAEDIDSPNPIAPDRAERANLDYLALGDWHGSKKISDRIWYSGTPEQDRYKSNDPGNVLMVDVPGGGSAPSVDVRSVGQHRWVEADKRLAVASDLDQLVAWVEDLPDSAVVKLNISGETDLQGYRHLYRVLSIAGARFRSLTFESTDLNLQPTEEDIASLRADGYVGHVIDELREEQDKPDGQIARDAMAILATLMADKRDQGGAA